MLFFVTEQLRIFAANMSLANKLSIEDVDLKGKRVLIRVSPLNKRCTMFGAGIPCWI